MRELKQLLSINLILVMLLSVLSPVSVLAADTEHNLLGSMVNAEENYEENGKVSIANTDVDWFSILPLGNLGIEVGESIELKVANLPEGATEDDVVWEYDSNYVTLTGNTLTAIAAGMTGISASVIIDEVCVAYDYRYIAAYTLSGDCSTEEVASDLTWEIDLDEGIFAISGQGEMPDYTAVYSEMGYENSNAPWYPYFRAAVGNDYIDRELKVVVEDGVANIGDQAFCYCYTLTSMIVPNSVTSVGTLAFGDTGLTSVYFEGNAPSVTEASSYDATFGSNVTLYYISGTSGWTDSEYYDAEAGTWNGYKLETWDGNTEVESVIDSGYCGGEGDGTNLTWTLTPNGTLTISGEGMMENFEYKGATWWEHQDNIKTVCIEDGVTSIGEYAFSECDSIMNVMIPSSVVDVCSGAFYQCNSLISVTIPNSVTSIGSAAFECCYSLTSVKIPNSITSIGEYAFNACHALTNVTIGNSVTSIGEYAFAFCGLTSVTLPNNVRNIGWAAFYECDSLTSVTIGNDVTSIGERAFAACDKLIYLYVSESNSEFCAVDAVLYSKDMTQLHTVSAAKKGTFTIPSSVTSIGDEAFHSCDKLTSVVIPNSVTSIGVAAFSCCDSLTSVTIGNSVECIGAYAFEFCDSLTSVTIPNGVTRIDSAAFYGCYNLTSAYFEGDAPDVNSGALDSNVTFYYIPGTSGWIDSEYYDAEAGTWNGYKLATWNGNVGETEEEKPLSSVDYLALSDLAYEELTEAAKSEQTILEYLRDENKWEQLWDSTDISYATLYSNLKNWKIIDDESNEDTGFYAAAFQNQDEIIIAYRGSRNLNDFSDVADLIDDWIWNDFLMLLGGKGSQVKNALTFYDTIRKNNPECTVIVTGHSLGGGLADIVAARYGCKGESFNSAQFLDVAYWHLPMEMSESFSGVDEYTFVSQVNVNDTLVGNYSYEVIKPKKIYEHNAKYEGFAHNLKSMVFKNSDGTVRLTDKISDNMSRTSVQHRMLKFQQPVIALMSSYADYVDYCGTLDGFASTPILSTAIAMYGGDGAEHLFGLPQNVLNLASGDKMMGGRGNDELDGKQVDDLYIYHKGDGHDYIRDISGKDELHIYGFSEDETITIETEKDDRYINVCCDSDVLVSIDKNVRAVIWEAVESFTVHVHRGDQVEKENIIEFFNTKKFDYQMRVMCPVDIEILDEQGIVVYTINDGETGAYYTDYGNFYVFEEENGSYGKSLDLVEGYTVRILGNEQGTMGIMALDFGDGNLTNARYIENVAISSSTIATLEKNSAGEDVLQVDTDGNGMIDENILMESSGIASGYCGGEGDGTNLTWALASDGTLTISGEGAMADADSFEGEEMPWIAYWEDIVTLVMEDGVTSIGDSAFESCENLKSAVLPSSVELIDHWAFSDCYDLESIIIPEGVEKIGTQAFVYCESLTRVDIPASVTIIESAFDYCWNLSTIAVNANNSCFSSADGVLFNKDQTTLLCCPGGKEGSYAIPNTVVTIGEDAFDGCDKLTAVNIPDSVRMIGADAFRNCALSEVSIPNGVETIREGAFEWCYDLQSVSIPESVTEIGAGAFAGCIELVDFQVDEDNAQFCAVDSILYSKDQKTLMMIPGSLTGDFEIPNSVECIWNYAFSGCEELTGVTIPVGVTSIGEYAFEECYGLQSIAIPDGVTEIGSYTFRWCESLTSVTIPRSVIVIGNSAFHGCDALADVYYSGSVDEWNNIEIGIRNVALTEADIHYMCLGPDTKMITIDPNGGTWEDGAVTAKIFEVNLGTITDLSVYLEQITRPGYIISGWTDENNNVEYAAEELVSLDDGETLYAVWMKDQLVIGDTSYSTTEVHSGTGWSYTPADDEEAAQLTLSAGYNSGSISFTGDLDVLIDGSFMEKGDNAAQLLYVLGDLSIVALKGVEVELQGGTGTTAIEAIGDVSITNYGNLSIIGGAGGSGVFAGEDFTLVNDSIMTVVGGIHGYAFYAKGEMVLSGSGKTVLVSGGDIRAVSSGDLVLDASLKSYSGQNSSTATRSKLLNGKYVRIEPKTVIVTLNPVGGTLGEEVTLSLVYSQTAENEITLAGADPVRFGYDFLGWNTSADGSGDAYEIGETYALSDTTDELNLFATWDKQEFAHDVEAGELILSIKQEILSDAILIVASYQDGKMLESDDGELRGEYWYFNAPKKLDDLKLIVMDQTYAPIHEVRLFQAETEG